MKTAQQSAKLDMRHVVGTLEIMTRDLWDGEKPGTVLLFTQEQMERLLGDALKRARRVRRFVSDKEAP